jgi:hypothetical protein
MQSDDSRDQDIHHACEQVFLQVAHLTDHGPQQDIADLFEEDGQLDREGTLICGRADLKASYAKRPPELMTRHLVSNFVARPLSATETMCTAYATVYRFRGAPGTRPEPPVTCAGPESIVEYSDHFVLTAQGWRIRRRTMRTVITVKSPA